MTLIKIVLVIGVLGIAALLVRHHGTNRGGAYAKIGLGVFLVFAAYAVVRPEDVTWVAGLLGVGRGADLVLYLLVIGFGFFAISTYLRFKELELRIARLARALAVSDAQRRDQTLATDGERPTAAPAELGDEEFRSASSRRK
ncbi:DUF2304 domain-containing protein [Nakamurella leprariae]|uniref:DUF2304 domain-containing protein n=1 Tax=Nakamurella leprariae TaxID=2803911 RepID=A0A938YH29_9ACTN|nr:DUF2304 domain-containing protein [Nakamurella leprariae]MBM9467703.1 DUF2304 domain-containing protein [Nakamurella leprariae]